MTDNNLATGKAAELRALLAKATKGPWVEEREDGWMQEYPRNTAIRCEWKSADASGAVGREIARMSGVHGQTSADAALIVAAVNALPALLDVVEAAAVLDNALHPTPRSRGQHGMGDGLCDHEGPNAIKAKALLRAALAKLDTP
jgi:hypothetical protein